MVDYRAVITARKEYEEVDRRVRYRRRATRKNTFLQHTLARLRSLLDRSGGHAKSAHKPTISTA